MFVGRQQELATLQSHYDNGGFQFAVVFGRRRVGKTALLNEFARDKRTLFFTALEQSDADNLRDFSTAIAQFFGLPSTMGSFASWTDAIDYLAERAEKNGLSSSLTNFPMRQNATKRSPPFSRLPSTAN